MQPSRKVVIMQPEPVGERDPAVSLDGVSRAFVFFGWLIVVGGVILGVALASELGLPGFLMGLGVALGGGSWLFFGYAGRCLARIAVCTEFMAKDRHGHGTNS